MTRNRMTIILMLVTLMAGSGYGNAVAKDKFQAEVDKELAAVKLVREVQRGDYGVVTAAELKHWIDGGKAMIIVDTMPMEASYKKQHIPTAIQFLFPIPEMKSWEVKETDGKTLNDYKLILGPDLAKPIVVYCGFVKCTRSHNGAAWARKLGYQNVYRFSGGLYAWRGSDFPLEKGD